MFRNFLKTAFRNLGNHRINSVINIAGLTIGFAAFLLIFQVILYEQSFDQFHSDKNRIYRVVRVGKEAVNREYRTGVPFPVTQTLRHDFPQVTGVAAIYGARDVQVDVTGANGAILKKFKESKGVFIAEPQFFRMFNFPLLQGNPRTLLEEPNTAALTREAAIRYFGDWKAAVNQTIQLFGNKVRVTGILQDPPPNTDFPLEVVVSYSTFFQGDMMQDWGSISDDNYCFVELPAGFSPARFEPLLARFTKNHITPVNPGYDLQLQPLKEIHYDGRFGNFNGKTFSEDLIRALGLIALFLLIIACFNFINLTTAHAINRNREVGVRKVVGSSRGQIVIQFLVETGLICLIALAGSLILMECFLPALNNLLEIQIPATLLETPTRVMLLAGGFCLVVLLSGFYPAVVLSGFRPSQVLKSQAISGKGKGIPFRQALVVFQFVIAQALILATLVVGSQMNFFRNADMGFNKEAVIEAGFPRDSLSLTKTEALKGDLLRVPGIEEVSFSMFSPISDDNWATDLDRPGNHGKTPDLIVNMKPADTAYFRLYGLKLLCGRIYFPSDTIREFVVNETLVRKLGFRDPSGALGMLVRVNGTTAPIVGVVKDFHVNSLRDPIDPVVMTTLRNGYGTANIRISPGRATKAIAAIQAIWDKTYPDYEFSFGFVAQEVSNFYHLENQFSILFRIFSFLAIFISCMGLYGLMAFMALRRKKEIGVRKVLGAPVRDIVLRLSREFTILITIAFLVAAPIGWYFMNEWLQAYTYRISLGIGFFLATVISSLAIAWLTVGYTAFKAAKASPVISLKAD